MNELSSSCLFITWEFWTDDESRRSENGGTDIGASGTRADRRAYLDVARSGPSPDNVSEAGARRSKNVSSGLWRLRKFSSTEHATMAGHSFRNECDVRRSRRGEAPAPGRRFRSRLLNRAKSRNVEPLSRFVLPAPQHPLGLGRIGQQHVREVLGSFGRHTLPLNRSVQRRGVLLQGPGGFGNVTRFGQCVGYRLLGEAVGRLV